MPTAWFTYILIAVNIAVSYKGFGAFRDGFDAGRFLLIPYQVLRGRNLQGLLLSQFAHADITHLIFNMMTLFFFGPVVEAVFGATGFLAIYAFSALGSTALTLAWRRRDPDYRALGASGAISGILFAAIVANPGMNVFLFFIPIPIPSPIFAVLYLFASAFFMKREMGNVAHEAHLGGALAGFLLAGLLLPEGFGNLIGRFRDFLPM